MVALLLALAVIALPAPAQEAPPDEASRSALAAALAAAVDLPAPEERRRAALELAQREATLDEWLATARAFGAHEPVPAGVTMQEFAIVAGGEATRIEAECYVPAAYDPAEPAPLMLVAHGTGGSGRGLTRMWKAVADELGMLVVAPSEAGANEGYGFTPFERDQLLGALRAARRRFNVDERRVHLSGISRGGHLVWDVALRRPDRFASIAPMIGAPRLLFANGQNNVRYVENVAHLSIRDLQGARDDPILVFNVRYAFERLAELGARDAQLIEHPELGHAFDPDAVDWSAFLGGAARDPLPRAVVRAAANEAETRSFWVEITRFDRAVAETFQPQMTRDELAEYGRLDNQGKLVYLHEQCVERTARLRATMDAPGRFTATSERVDRARLLVTRDMLDEDGRAVVDWNGRERKKRPKESAKVLLLDFVERFDRTFLPVAEIELP